MYACTGILSLTVKLMFFFIKQIRNLCLANTNIVLQQWYARFIFYSIYVQCMNTANDLFWLHILPALARCRPDILHFIRKWTTILIISASPQPAHFLPNRQRILGENVNVWNDRNIFTLLAKNRYYYFFENY